MARARPLIGSAAFAAVLALLAAPTVGASDTAVSRTASDQPMSEAESGTTTPELALQRALAILAPSEVDATFRAAVASVDPREATLVLRDLIKEKARLSAADRQLAERLLARPSDKGGLAGYGGVPRSERERACTARFCVHWVTQGSEKPSLKDRRPNNNRPDYVDKTIANMKTVWNTTIGDLGWKKPLPDRSSGGHNGGNPNKKIDIFIAQIGDAGIYGYCTSDMPGTKRQVSAYCVIDNDFRRSEFRNGATGNAANKVTLAHEFHHAIQFAYDAFENKAMMEGTATWMEDQVFTSINDNRQYLTRTSPLGSLPWQSLDRFFTSGTFALWPYGTWIWYRFLSENLGPGASDRPVVIRRIWKQAVGKARQGFGAIAVALAAEGRTLLEEMRTFGEWNAAPRAAGRYGEANQGSGYPTPDPVSGPPVVTEADVTFPIARRANDYLRLRPDSSLVDDTELDFSGVSIPTARGDIEAIVIRDNGVVENPVDVANGGFVPFDTSVSEVIVVFTNASGSSFTSSNTFDFVATVDPP